MDIVVSDEAKSLAVKYRKGFSCLDKEKAEICKAEKCLLESVLYIQCRDDSYCNFSYVIGGNTFCSCSVRKEIFLKYNI